MNNKKQILSFCCIFLAFFSLFIFYFFSTTDTSENEDTKFLSFTEELFSSQISIDALTLHYTFQDPESQGLSTPDPIFLPYEESTLQENALFYENLLGSLSSFSYNSLNEENKLTYDVLTSQISYNLALCAFPFYEEVLIPSLGIQAQLPILLAEYTFLTEQDVLDYLSLISSIDTYYESLLSYEIQKSNLGLFMNEDSARAIISQCTAFLFDTEEHFLLSTFEDKVSNLDSISEESKASYISQNEELFLEHVVPAYELLIDGLLSLVSTGTNPYGLCYYPQGSDYYEALVAATLGSSKSMEEWKILLYAQINSDLSTMREVLSKDLDFNTLYSSSLAFEDPVEMLEALNTSIEQDFPLLSNIEYTVKYVDPALQDYVSPAFYLSPPLDNINYNIIYINNAVNYTDLSLFTTLAHEGYPGHLYQNAYELSEQINPVRNLFYFGGYTEGWATYIEQYAYFYSGLDTDVATFQAANNSFSLGLYAAADIGIHYDGWLLEDLVLFFSEYGISDFNTIETIYQSILDVPGNYLKYYLGFVEFENMKEQTMSALGDSFSLKDYHEFVLSLGSAPFSVLESYLDSWLDGFEITFQAS